MPSWLERKIRLTINWISLSLFKRRHEKLINSTAISECKQKNCLGYKHHKRKRYNVHLQSSSQNNRMENEKYLKHCERVYTEQNNCAWRCAQQSHPHSLCKTSVTLDNATSCVHRNIITNRSNYLSKCIK